MPRTLPDRSRPRQAPATLGKLAATVSPVASQADVRDSVLVATLVVLGVALAWLLPGLGTPGLWSDAELPVLDRALAALGEARTGMQRSPAVPDALRTACVRLFGNEIGLRLPHAIASAAVVAAAAWLALARGLGKTGAILAAVIAISMPVFATGGRLALGNPFGECFGVWAVVAATHATRTQSSRARAIATVLALAGVGLAIASTGLVLGGILPGIAIFAIVQPRRTASRAAIGLLLAVAGGIAVMLMLRQTDGYIPLLGAAKDLELVDKPELRRFTAALADLGHESFPWLPLGLVGLAIGRDRQVAVWLLGGIVVASAWSLHYGRLDVPLRVPLALGATAAVLAIADPRQSRAARRAAVLLAALGIMVMAKDLELSPEDIAVPMHLFAVNDYPAIELRTADRLGGFAKLLALALLAGLVLARHQERAGPLERLLARIRPDLRDRAAPLLVAVAALVGAWQQSRTLVVETSEKLSPRHVLDVFAGLVESGEVAPTLASHRVRDPGLAHYGPTDLLALGNRRDIFEQLGGEEARAVLLRSIDLPAVFQQHRSAARDFFVLDDSHFKLRLVANVLPDGWTDRNRIPEVLSHEPHVLANDTYVRFEEFVEIMGWEVDGPLVRGRKHTLQLAIRVLRPLPGGAKIFARFLGGRLSRINPDPQPLAEDLYPCNLWRNGDYILHRYEFTAPALEILPGEYDFVIGLRRSETKNFEISQPEGADGDFDVRIDDPKRAFAKIGRVQVW